MKFSRNKKGRAAIQLSDHFTYAKLFRFTLPSVIMMIFTSIYGVVDGFFISNFVGKTSFAAINFILPVLMILGTVGFMFGTGGSALVAKTLGEGKRDKANRLFSMLVYATAISGVIVGVIGFMLIRPIAMLLGANGEMLEDCVLYGHITLVSMPALMLQYEFQSFFITAEKPKLGLAVTVAAGITNIVLDALLIVVLRLGTAGASLATAISQFVGGVIPIIYFMRKNTSLLRLTKTRYYGRSMRKACINGSSEMMANISMSLISILYNIQLIKYAGENGVAAYGVLMDINYVFLSAFIGYAVGAAPIVGFHFGADNRPELQSLLKKSIVIISCLAAAMFISAELLAYPLAKLFVGYDKALFDMTLNAFRIFSFSFLFAGFAIGGSSFFTALNDGLTSALISFLRTLVFQIAAVLLLPIAFGIDGIWYSIPAAEFIAAAVTAAFVVGKRGKYGY
ncbi:MAG: MATE family efflux transporter [Clostridia bacterium]|nr:MATE family efflux transporter [Clostridia bacterium]